jgi:hypothetical protein
MSGLSTEHGRVLSQTVVVEDDRACQRVRGRVDNIVLTWRMRQQDTCVLATLLVVNQDRVPAQLHHWATLKTVERACLDPGRMTWINKIIGFDIYWISGSTDLCSHFLCIVFSACIPVDD